MGLIIKMGEIIAKTDIIRDPNYIYYCAFDQDGYVLIGKAKFNRGGTKGSGKKQRKNAKNK